MRLQANGSQQKVVYQYLDKTDFKAKEVTRDRDGHYINLKRGGFHQEDITFINAYALNIGAAKYKKQLLKELKKLTATEK